MDLTKEQYFAAHAPDVPDWYREFWATLNKGDNSLVVHWNENYPESGADYKIQFESGRHFSITYPLGEMLLMRDWRYEYAEMMLNGERK